MTDLSHYTRIVRSNVCTITVSKNCLIAYSYSYGFINFDCCGFIVIVEDGLKLDLKVSLSSIVKFNCNTDWLVSFSSLLYIRLIVDNFNNRFVLLIRLCINGLRSELSSVISLWIISFSIKCSCRNESCVSILLNLPRVSALLMEMAFYNYFPPKIVFCILVKNILLLKITGSKIVQNLSSAHNSLNLLSILLGITFSKQTEDLLLLVNLLICWSVRFFFLGVKQFIKNKHIDFQGKTPSSHLTSRRMVVFPRHRQDTHS